MSARGKPCNDCKDRKADQADGEENVKRMFSVVIVLGRLSDFCGRDPSTHDQRSKGIFGKADTLVDIVK